MTSELGMLLGDLGTIIWAFFLLALSLFLLSVAWEAFKGMIAIARRTSDEQIKGHEKYWGKKYKNLNSDNSLPKKAQDKYRKEQ